MSKSESLIMKEIQIEASVDGVMLFRNNVGGYKTDAGHYVHFGVGGKGGSDLIGVTSVTVTPDMVGRKMGVMTAIEVKSASGRATEQQEKFISAMRKTGAIAGVARSPSDLREIIKRWKNGSDNQ